MRNLFEDFVEGFAWLIAYAYGLFIFAFPWVLALSIGAAVAILVYVADV